MLPPSFWHDLVRTIKPFAPAVRVKWSDNDEPTEWQLWIILPAASYLEVATLGPVPFREVEWVEVDPSRQNATGRLVAAIEPERREALLAALGSAGLSYTSTDSKLRFAAPSA